MTIEDGLKAFLASSPYPLAVHGRVYSHKAPQPVAAPYVVFYRVTPTPRMTQTGPTATIEWAYQFSAFAATQSAALAIGDALRKLLAGYRGLMGSVDVRACIWETSRYSYNETSGLHQFSSDFRITFIEQ